MYSEVGPYRPRFRPWQWAVLSGLCLTLTVVTLRHDRKVELDVRELRRYGLTLNYRGEIKKGAKIVYRLKALDRLPAYLAGIRQGMLVEYEVVRRHR